MILTRRSLFQWLAGVAAGTVLAKMPLAGNAPALNHPYPPLRQFMEFENIIFSELLPCVRFKEVNHGQTARYQPSESW